MEPSQDLSGDIQEESAFDLIKVRAYIGFAT
jgi:hypothetical protein